MHFNYDEKHNLTFRFESNDGERSLEMNCNELFINDILYRFKEFLQGCGYEINGEIEVVEYDSEDYEDDLKESPKFDFSNIPNNNWPFGGLTSEPIPALTTAQINSFQSIPIDELKVNQFPTMAPLTKEQIESWKMEMPGTLGGAKVKF